MTTSYVKEHKNNWRLNKSICIKKKTASCVAIVWTLWPLHLLKKKKKTTQRTNGNALHG